MNPSWIRNRLWPLLTLLFGYTLAQPLASGQDLPTNPFLNNGVTAHRGFSTAYPENTIRAFEAALEVGADWLECDIFMTKDQKLVVIHDASTGRVAQEDLRVTDSTYEQLQTLDVAHAFRIANNLDSKQCPVARIPLLSEVLQLVINQQKSRLSIQPKDGSTPAALELIRTLNAERWVGFNDGDYDKLVLVKQFDKSIPVFWDRGPNTDMVQDLAMAKQIGVETLVIHHSGMTVEKTALLHENGFAAGAWTVNAPVRMKQLLEMGVDRIYTDAPDELLRLKKLAPLGL